MRGCVHRTILAAFLMLLARSRQKTTAAAQTMIGHGFNYGSVPTPVGYFPASVSTAKAVGYTSKDNAGLREGFGYPFQMTATDDESMEGIVHPFTLYYSSTDDTGELTAFTVTGPEGRTADGQLVPLLGTVPIGDGLVAYDVVLGSSSTPLQVAGISIPSTVEEAESLGWSETACVEHMGGAHFAIVAEDQGDFIYLLQPIYDKYGTGQLSAVQLAFGADNLTRPGFDLQDGSSNSMYNACRTSVCANPVCVSDGPEAVSSVHVYFGDPGINLETGAVASITCQMGTDNLCYTDGCSCCGGPDATLEELKSHCFSDEYCATCQVAAPCFTAMGCALYDPATIRWSGLFEECNQGANFCGTCFPDSPCVNVTTDRPPTNGPAMIENMTTTDRPPTSSPVMMENAPTLEAPTMGTPTDPGPSPVNTTTDNSASTSVLLHQLDWYLGVMVAVAVGRLL